MDYLFDAVGNRQSVADSAAPTLDYTVNDVNQYGTATSTAGVDTFTHDAAGNLDSAVNSAPGSLKRRLVYDLANRLSETWNEATGTGGATSDYRRFLYDGQNRVVAVVHMPIYHVESGTFRTHRKHVWDGWNLIEESADSDPQGQFTKT